MAKKMKHLHHYRAMMKSGGMVKSKFEDIKDTIQDLLYNLEDIPGLDGESIKTTVWYYPDKGGYEFRFRLSGKYRLSEYVEELDRIDEYMESMGFYFRYSSTFTGHKKFDEWATRASKSFNILNQTDFFYTNNRRSLRR